MRVEFPYASVLRALGTAYQETVSPQGDHVTATVYRALTSTKAWRTHEFMPSTGPLAEALVDSADLTGKGVSAIPIAH